MAKPRISEHEEVREGLTEIGDIENPYDAGTNAFFKSIAWTDEDVTLAVENHGKINVQHAARIGYDLIQMASNGDRVVAIGSVDVLPELVALYGSEIIRHLLLMDRLTPSQISQKYSVTQSNGLTCVMADRGLEARVFKPLSPNGRPQKYATANSVLVQYKQ